MRTSCDTKSRRAGFGSVKRQMLKSSMREASLRGARSRSKTRRRMRASIITHSREKRAWRSSRDRAQWCVVVLEVAQGRVGMHTSYYFDRLHVVLNKRNLRNTPEYYFSSFSERPMLRLCISNSIFTSSWSSRAWVMLNAFLVRVFSVLGSPLN